MLLLAIQSDLHLANSRNQVAPRQFDHQNTIACAEYIKASPFEISRNKPVEMYIGQHGVMCVALADTVF